MKALTVFRGDRAPGPFPPDLAFYTGRVRSARGAGYRVGARVWLGHVPGRVIGYNIGRNGLFPGYLFPLLVDTPSGVVKCSVREVTLAPPPAGQAEPRP